MASNEGGSNQILVRGPWRVTASRRLTLARLPERRRMLWARLERPDDGAALCVANLHASAHRPQRAAREVELAARAAYVSSLDTPLVLGGDFNVRPVEEPWLFERLRAGYGYRGRATGEHRIDHVFARLLEPADGPRVLDHVVAGVELSDHAPVSASFVE
jgi:endonuclease/exonuclease/phosphatase family metal-dependent hydrolase